MLSVKVSDFFEAHLASPLQINLDCCVKFSSWYLALSWYYWKKLWWALPGLQFVFPAQLSFQWLTSEYGQDSFLLSAYEFNMTSWVIQTPV